MQGDNVPGRGGKLDGHNHLKLEARALSNLMPGPENAPDGFSCTVSNDGGRLIVRRIVLSSR
ncbi:hypothetical protein [Nitrobacter sp.]|uniref:hypothetical protein n=1 Tax=Nitrobacter sp. TaxID=29420 RepID=UPI00399D6090